jgi:hypothetical protein
MYLVRVRHTTHTTHDTEYVVVDGVDTDLGSSGALDGGTRKNELEGGVVNAREIARTRRLVLLWAESKRVKIDTSVRSTGVVLPRLNKIEVGALTLRESVVAVKLKLGGDYRVLAPAVHVERGLGENKRTRIRHRRGGVGSGSGVDAIKIGGWSGLATSEVGETILFAGGAAISRPLASNRISYISGTGIVEHARGINESGGVSSKRVHTTEGVHGVRKDVERIGVVERLSTEKTVKTAATLPRSTVVYVLVRLYNPDKFLARVVERKLDLVGRGTNRLVASELKLLNKVLVGVLGHAAALIGVKEDVVNVERSGNKRLLVGGRNFSATGAFTEGTDRPEALLNGAKVNVESDLVVLKGNKRKGKTRVAAEPELKRNVKGGLRKSIAWSAYLARGSRLTRTINVRERRVGDEGKLGGVTNHLEVTTLLLRGEGKLHPDVHPVTVLAINALTTDFNLNLRDKLMTREIEPPSVYRVISSYGRVRHRLVDFRKSYLEVGSVGKITITRNGTGYATTEIGLTVEGLLDRLHREVSVTSVGNFPESNLGISSKVYILSTISYEL